MSASSCGRPCRVMSLVLAAAIGGLFGAGLIVSGMTQPARVIGFLDVLGGWDPTLAFVMAGAVIVYALAFPIIRRRVIRPWFDAGFHLPERRDIDGALVLGAALFGIGWAIAGLCPGPAIVSAGAGSASVIAFVAAMATGTLLASRARRR